jgi:hypothetical protein
MLLLGGFSCVETPHVGHGKGADAPCAGLTGEVTDTGASLPLADTTGSLDSCWSIRVQFLEDRSVSLSRYRVKRTQRLSTAARFSQPVHGLIPIAYVIRLITSPRPISSSLM